jgi:serine/threonine protein kinase
LGKTSFLILAFNGMICRNERIWFLAGIVSVQGVTMISSPLFCTHCGAANLAQVAFCYACGQPIQTPEHPAGSGPLRVGSLLKQRYQIIQRIGTGGFGAVYRAEDQDLGRRLVAVKEMSQYNLDSQAIAEATRAFKQEALLLADLMHEHLPRIYDHFTEGGRWYLVMDYIRGETLETYLAHARGNRLPLNEALDIALQLCTVLNYLHTRQPPIIFRDLKPSNVILTPEKRVFLIDFGIARHFKPGQAKDTIAFGSPGYAPPEQYGKTQTTPRADIYSLGAIIHQMLSGADPSLLPFRFAPLTLNAPALQQLLQRMLELDENNRPASLTAVIQELQQIKEQPQRKPDQARQPAISISLPRVTRPVSGPIILIYEGHASRVHTVAWSSNSAYLASASDEIIRVWEAQSGQDICTYQHHFSRIVAMAWARDSMQIASLSQDNSLRIWDANTGKTLDSDSSNALPKIGRLRLLAWSPDARFLALAGDSRTIEILDINTRQHGATLQSRGFLGCNALAWSPNGQYMAAASANTVSIWDVNTGALLRTYDHSANVDTIAWSPNSCYIASCGSGKILQIWLALTGELVSMWSGEHFEHINTLSWSPRGRMIISGGIMGDLLVWHILTDRQEDLKIWNVQKNQQIGTYTGHTGGILSVAWSPNGRFLASGGADEKVRVWSAPDDRV